MVRKKKKRADVGMEAATEEGGYVDVSDAGVFAAKKNGVQQRQKLEQTKRTHDQVFKNRRLGSRTKLSII
jgi:hypothetical protein